MDSNKQTWELNKEFSTGQESEIQQGGTQNNNNKNNLKYWK